MTIAVVLAEQNEHQASRADFQAYLECPYQHFARLYRSLIRLNVDARGYSVVQPSISMRDVA